MNPRKISHTVFDIRQTQHLWIEEHDGHYAIFTKSDLNGAMQPTLLGMHESLLHAQANLNAVPALFAPNMVEGTQRDVSEFDNRKGVDNG